MQSFPSWFNHRFPKQATTKKTTGRNQSPKPINQRGRNDVEEAEGGGEGHETMTKSQWLETSVRSDFSENFHIPMNVRDTISYCHIRQTHRINICQVCNQCYTRTFASAHNLTMNIIVKREILIMKHLWESLLYFTNTIMNTIQKFYCWQVWQLLRVSGTSLC